MSEYSSVQISSFVKGINASASKTNQPQGSIPRASNMLLTRRGSLVACDGSQIIHAFNGVPTANRGRILAALLFAPTGVGSYYIMLASAPDLPISIPTNLTLATAAGGTLPAATYFYKVTALDGIGGETTASIESSIITAANGKNTLTWNIVPNASSYNIYRSTSSTTEVLLTNPNIPVNQPSTGTLTASFIDDGSSTTPIYTVSTASVYQSGAGTGLATFNLTTLATLINGAPFTLAGSTNLNFNRLWTVFGGAFPSTSFTARFTGFGLNLGANTTGGTFTTGTPPPIANTTQQIALFKLPIIPGIVAPIPVSYNNSNIVSLFPASLHTTSSPASGGGGTGSGGGSGTSGGGSGTGGGSGGPGQGGRPINTL